VARATLRGRDFPRAARTDLVALALGAFLPALLALTTAIPQPGSSPTGSSLERE
jgi:hypothetical protein